MVDSGHPPVIFIGILDILYLQIRSLATFLAIYLTAAYLMHFEIRKKRN
jgi:hypothetical protein